MECKAHLNTKTQTYDIKCRKTRKFKKQLILFEIRQIDYTDYLIEMTIKTNNKDINKKKVEELIEQIVTFELNAFEPAVFIDYMLDLLMFEDESIIEKLLYREDAAPNEAKLEIRVRT